jgi:thiol-disulfide isomerase/thioredoxin
VAKWKKWAKELAVMAVVTVIAAGVIGYLRAPKYENAALPPIQTVLLDGSGFDSAAAGEKPYVLHFWAIWCPVCRAEAGNIDALAKEARVVTVAVKSGSDEEVADYMHENGLSFPVVNDQNGAIAAAYKIAVFPTTIIVGKEGKVFWAESGYSTTWGLRFRLWLAEHFS